MTIGILRKFLIFTVDEAVTHYPWTNQGEIWHEREYLLKLRPTHGEKKNEKSTHRVSEKAISSTFQANLASCSHWDGQWVPAKVRWRSVAGD